MRDWNVIATVRDGGFRRARQLLGEFGPVQATGFLNVLVLRVDDPKRLLEALTERWTEEAEFGAVLGRVLPVSRTFSFQSPEEFETKAREAALQWVPQLAGKAFHVRLHRRGFKGRLSSPDEERFLDGTLLAALEEAGAPGRITFENPDAILIVETLGNQAGMSLWTREELQRYPSLRLD